MAGDVPEFIDPVEDCPWRTPREILARYGYTPVPPTELNDRQLPGRLWELLYAAAARRIFFYGTDHLSDREFYTLLWEEWLDEPAADIPLEAETNTNVGISEMDARGMTAEEIYLRYYADEEDRERWPSGEPGEVLPPHEEPPYDRDRFLPVAPIPLEAHAGWLPGDDDPPVPDSPETGEVPDGKGDDDDHDDDPLGLAAVDKEIAAEKEPAPNGDGDESNPALEAKLEAMEPGNWTPPAQKLAEENIPLLPPDEITDETLTPVLWELLHNLALRGFYVLHTDHMSDRGLYAELWERGLRDPALLPGRNPRGGWFHDFLGSWGDEQMQLWLRYYATDEQRAKHAAEYPKDTIPPKEKPQCNRDWRLPKGPF